MKLALPSMLNSVLADRVHCYDIIVMLPFYFSERGPVHANLWQNVMLATRSLAGFLNDWRFQHNATVIGSLDNFDSPYNIGNNYALQMWSYFLAPEAGLYTFYSACDDMCQVFLSSTDRKEDKEMIIFQKGWTPQYDYLA